MPVLVNTVRADPGQPGRGRGDIGRGDRHGARDKGRYPPHPRAADRRHPRDLASRLLDLGGHGAATVGTIPRGLPTLGLPAFDRADASALLGLSAAMFVVILAQSAATARAYAAKYNEPLEHPRRPERAWRGQRGGRVLRHVRGQRQPHQGAGSGQRGRPQPAGPAHRRRRGPGHRRAAHRAARLPAAGRPGRCGLPDRGRADRPQADAAHPQLAAERVRRRPAHGGGGGSARGRGRHRARRHRLGRRSPEAQLQPAQQRPCEVTGRILAAGTSRAGRADRGRNGDLPVRHEPLLRQRGPAASRPPRTRRYRTAAELVRPRLRGHRGYRLHRVHGPCPRGRNLPAAAHTFRGKHRPSDSGTATGRLRHHQDPGCRRALRDSPRGAGRFPRRQRAPGQ